MKIHLVTGFMQSGKTTAISTACKLLAEKGMSTSVIRDNQEAFMVNKLPLPKFGIQVAKVNGGCGCCSFVDLEAQINNLKKKTNPAIIFAEYSGTCTSLSQALLQPLKEYKKGDIELATFSTFVEAKMLWHFLKKEPLPLSAELNFTFEKHLKEAENLIITRIDEFKETVPKELIHLCKQQFPSMEVILLNPSDKKSVENWLETIQHNVLPTTNSNEKNQAPEEENLAWLDEEIQFVSSQENSLHEAFNFALLLSNQLIEKQLHINHLHYLFSFQDKTLRLSHADVLRKKEEASVSFENVSKVNLMVHARIKTIPENLRKILLNVIQQTRALDHLKITEVYISYFQR